MSAEEFTARLEANKKSFVINVNDRLEEFDVDTMVTNKKIKDAGICLTNGEFNGVEYALKDIPRDKYFSVERLYYLASMRVKNEFELTDCSFDIGGKKGSWEKQTQYDRAVALADEQTKETYRKIREYCLGKERVKNEIDEINKLFAVGLYDEAVTYAKKCVKTTRKPRTRGKRFTRRNAGSIRITSETASLKRQKFVPIISAIPRRQ